MHVHGIVATKHTKSMFAPLHKKGRGGERTAGAAALKVDAVDVVFVGLEGFAAGLPPAPVPENRVSTQHYAKAQGKPRSRRRAARNGAPLVKYLPPAPASPPRPFLPVDKILAAPACGTEKAILVG